MCPAAGRRLQVHCFADALRAVNGAPTAWKTPILGIRTGHNVDVKTGPAAAHRHERTPYTWAADLSPSGDHQDCGLTAPVPVHRPAPPPGNRSRPPVPFFRPFGPVAEDRPPG